MSERCPAFNWQYRCTRDEGHKEKHRFLYDDGTVVELESSQERAPVDYDAVWAAVYVRVLSSFYSVNAADQGIIAMAECLADPTAERMNVAIQAADMAVAKLRKKLT